MNDSSNDVDPRVVRRKVWWRTVPLIFVLYIVAYLDRANLGFAKSKMCEALDFSGAVYGWGAGLFFVGYLILEIPGALLVERWSARKWFARILITWGLCSMGMALVHNAWQFYTARTLLGLAEAGFFPGVIVYLSHWFPRAERARALAGMVLGIPVSLALGARVSGYLLEVHWLGLAGWQWVFIVEGLPAVLLGCAVPFLLTDRPRNAKWLTPAEADWLEQKLERERQEAAAIGVRHAAGSAQATDGLAVGSWNLRREHRRLCPRLLAPRRGQKPAAEFARSRHRYGCNELAFAGLSFWDRRRLAFRSIFGSIPRAEMALRGGNGTDRYFPGDQRDRRAVVEHGLSLALPGRLLRVFLAVAFLGAADADASTSRGGRRDWFH